MVCANHDRGEASTYWLLWKWGRSCSWLRSCSIQVQRTIWDLRAIAVGTIDSWDKNFPQWACDTAKINNLSSYFSRSSSVVRCIVCVTPTCLLHRFYLLNRTYFLHPSICEGCASYDWLGRYVSFKNSFPYNTKFLALFLYFKHSAHPCHVRLFSS